MSKNADSKVRLNFSQDHSLEFVWQDKDGKIQETKGVNALAEFYYRAFFRHIEVQNRAAILSMAALSQKLLKVSDKNPVIEIEKSDFDLILKEYNAVLETGTPGTRGPMKFSNMDIALLAACEKMWQEAQGGKPADSAGETQA